MTETQACVTQLVDGPRLASLKLWLHAFLVAGCTTISKWLWLVQRSIWPINTRYCTAPSLYIYMYQTNLQSGGANLSFLITCFSVCCCCCCCCCFVLTAPGRDRWRPGRDSVREASLFKGEYLTPGMGYPYSLRYSSAGPNVLLFSRFPVVAKLTVTLAMLGRETRISCLLDGWYSTFLRDDNSSLPTIPYNLYWPLSVWQLPVVLTKDICYHYHCNAPLGIYGKDAI